MTKVYDLNGQERDLAWLQTNYGARVAPSGASGAHFEVAEIRIQEGPAVVTVEVRDPNGAPLPDYAVAFSWPCAPQDLMVPEAAVFKTRFKPRAKVQWTASPNGDTGFGTGLGAYIQNISEGGPHAVWVLSDKYASDAVDRIGQLGGTNHRGPCKIMLRLTGGSTPPTEDPGEPGSAEMVALLREIRDLIKAGFRL